MSEVSDRYSRIAGGFAQRVGLLRPEDWHRATPCPDWDVRRLVAHVVNTNRAVVSNVVEEPPPEVDAMGDLTAQFEGLADLVREALSNPERAGRTIGGMFGDQSFESLVSRLLCSDTLLHTWDLAAATGQDTELDPEAVSMATTLLEPLDEALRRPGGFAPKISPLAGAGTQERLLNFAGRDPSWTAPT